MNIVDIAILGILLAFLVKGLIRGLLKEFCTLAGVVAGSVFAFRFHEPLGEVLAGFCPEPVARWGAFLALLLSILTLFSLAGFVLSRLVNLLFLGGLNRVAGGFFGMIQGCLLLAVLLFTLSLAELPKEATVRMKKSELSPPFVRLGLAAFEGSRDLFPGWR